MSSSRFLTQASRFLTQASKTPVTFVGYLCYDTSDLGNNKDNQD